MIKSSLPPSKKTSQRWRMEKKKKQRWKVDIIDVPYPEAPAAQAGCLLCFLRLSLVLFLPPLLHHLFFCHLSLSPVFTLVVDCVFPTSFSSLLFFPFFLTFHTSSVMLSPLLGFFFLQNLWLLKRISALWGWGFTVLLSFPANTLTCWMFVSERV